MAGDLVRHVRATVSLISAVDKVQRENLAFVSMMPYLIANWKAGKTGTSTRYYETHIRGLKDYVCIKSLLLARCICQNRNTFHQRQAVCMYGY